MDIHWNDIWQNTAFSHSLLDAWESIPIIWIDAQIDAQHDIEDMVC